MERVGSLQRRLEMMEMERVGGVEVGQTAHVSTLPNDEVSDWMKRVICMEISGAVEFGVLVPRVK